MTADDIIVQLNLAPHPEGGFYRQTWAAENDGRPTGTCIYFLLKDGEASHWHKVDATEIWHYYAGAPLILSISTHNGRLDISRLHSVTGFPVRRVYTCETQL